MAGKVCVLFLKIPSESGAFSAKLKLQNQRTILLSIPNNYVSLDNREKKRENLELDRYVDWDSVRSIHLWKISTHCY